MIKWPDFKNWKKTKEADFPSEDIVCKNCETEFRGHFCPNCGQSVKEFDKPFSFVIYNFAGDFFSFDTRFFGSFGLLLFYPGKLTNEFFAGRRVRHAPPFRIFIFVSFILFLLLESLSNQNLDTVLDASLDNNNFVKIEEETAKDIESVLIEAENQDTLKQASPEIDPDIFIGSGNLRQSLNKLAQYLENDLKQETDVRRQNKLREFIRLCRSPKEATAKVLKKLSWAFFLLLPVFALVLKLVYIRRNQNYIRHLIYSVHFHSFIFIDLILLITLKLIFGSVPEWIVLFFFMLIPFYFFVSLKKVYGQNNLKVLVKFFIISVFYNAIFSIVLFFVFFNALSIL